MLCPSLFFEHYAKAGRSRSVIDLRRWGNAPVMKNPMKNSVVAANWLKILRSDFNNAINEGAIPRRKKGQYYVSKSKCVRTVATTLV